MILFLYQQKSCIISFFRRITNIIIVVYFLQYYFGIGLPNLCVCLCTHILTKLVAVHNFVSTFSLILSHAFLLSLYTLLKHPSIPYEYARFLSFFLLQHLNVYLVEKSWSTAMITSLDNSFIF